MSLHATPIPNTNESDLHDYLASNSQAAIMAAIEIYNKPVFQYRDECTVILLLNAWELLLKAIMVKYGKSIYYPDLPRTLSWKDAFQKAAEHFPSTVARLSTQKNLDLLGSYRDKSLHFYNEKDISLVVYSLAQTSIINYSDVLQGVFGIDIADQMNLRLLPLGIRPPIDAISYIQSASKVKRKSAVSEYLAELMQTVEELESANDDTGRLLTVFSINLKSIKKIGDADAVVAVDNNPTQDNPLIAVHRQDPNQSHPLREKDVLSRIKELQEKPFIKHSLKHTFRAIVWKHGIRERPQYCWMATEGVLTRYSNDIIPFIKQLTEAEIQESLSDYGRYRSSRRKAPSP